MPSGSDSRKKSLAGGSDWPSADLHSIIYVDPSGNVGSEADFTYNESTNTLDVDNLTLTNALPIAYGGTAATSAAAALTALGAQAQDAALDDIAATAHPPANGDFLVGDGANWVIESGATARASLGVAIGTDVPTYDVRIETLAAIPSTGAISWNGTSWDQFTITAFAQTVLDDADAATARTTLGLAIGTDVQAYSAGLDEADTAMSSPTNTYMLYVTGGAWAAGTPSAIRTNLGLSTTDRVTFETVVVDSETDATIAALGTPSAGEIYHSSDHECLVAYNSVSGWQAYVAMGCGTIRLTDVASPQTLTITTGGTWYQYAPASENITQTDQSYLAITSGSWSMDVASMPTASGLFLINITASVSSDTAREHVEMALFVTGTKDTYLHVVQTMPSNSDRHVMHISGLVLLTSGADLTVRFTSTTNGTVLSIYSMNMTALYVGD